MHLFLHAFVSAFLLFRISVFLHFYIVKMRVFLHFWFTAFLHFRISAWIAAFILQ